MKYFNFQFSGEWWNANENCTLLETTNVTDPDSAVTNSSNQGFLGLKRCNVAENITVNCTYLETPATQFWEKYVLEITPNIGEPGDIGGFNFGLPLCLAFSWLVVFLCLMKGVKSSGKVSQNIISYIRCNYSSQCALGF